MKGRMENTGHIPSSDGSVMLEAVTGIAILALLGASLGTFHRSWVAASELTTARESALVVAVAMTEAAGLTGDQVRLPSAVVEEAASRGLLVSATTVAPTASRLGRCLGADGARVRGVGVNVDHAQEVPESLRLVSLVSARLDRTGHRGGSPGGSVAGARIQVGASGPSGLVIRDMTTGLEYAAQVDAAGCAVLPELPSGRYEARVAGSADTTFVDGELMTGDDLRFVFSILDRPSQGAWDVQAGARLTVQLETDGARTPDTVRSGALRWFVRGDERRIGLDIGATRTVPPGPTTIVVSACANPDAIASSARIVTLAGEDHVGTVSLPTVTLYGVGAWPEQALYALRVGGCADGSGLQPSMRWERGLFDGMRIAIPHGEWQLRVETLAGDRITAPATFAAWGSDLVVTVPP